MFTPLFCNMKERLQLPDMWLESHHSAIQERLELYRRSLLRDAPGDPTLHLEARTLAEMGLCRAHKRIVKKIGLPKGYNLARGWVSFSEVEGEDSAEMTHTFLKTGTQEIMDFTPGQFAPRQNEPGARIRFLKEKAPNLIKIFPSGLAVLQGSIDEISETLDITYHHDVLKGAFLALTTF